MLQVSTFGENVIKLLDVPVYLRDDFENLLEERQKLDVFIVSLSFFRKIVQEFCWLNSKFLFIVFSQRHCLLHIYDYRKIEVFVIEAGHNKVPVGHKSTHIVWVIPAEKGNERDNLAPQFSWIFKCMNSNQLIN